MSAEKLSQNIEIIDKLKEVDEKLTSLENKQAIEIIKNLDARTEYNMDLAFDSKANKYFFIVNNSPLNISLDFKDVFKIWEQIVKLLNMKEDLLLHWDKFNRWIWYDRILGYKIILDGNENWLTKKQVEKIFSFLMTTKGKEITEKNIAADICANWVKNQNCVDKYKNLI